mgnify:CR=1 FL=1
MQHLEEQLESQTLYGLAGEEALLSIGETRLGKPILALRLGNPEEPTLYLGGFHAQEWITTLALFCFAREILGCGKSSVW